MPGCGSACLLHSTSSPGHFALAFCRRSAPRPLLSLQPIRFRCPSPARHPRIAHASPNRRDDGADTSMQQLASELVRHVKEASKAEQQKSRGPVFATCTHVLVLSSIAVFFIQHGIVSIIASASSATDILTQISPLTVKDIGSAHWDLLAIREAMLYTLGIDALKPLVLAFCHVNLFQLWVSVSALHTAGNALETVVGGGRLLAIAAVSAWVTNLVNMHVIGQPVCGLSGVASGVVGATFILSTWEQALQSKGIGKALFGSMLWLGALGLFLPSIDHRVHVIGLVTGAVAAILLQMLPPLHLPLLAVASSLSTTALMLLCGYGGLRHVLRII